MKKTRLESSGKTQSALLRLYFTFRWQNDWTWDLLLLYNFNVLGFLSEYSKAGKRQAHSCV